MDTTEKNFEASIEETLIRDPFADTGGSVQPFKEPPTSSTFIPGGYQKRKPEDYDRSLCLVPGDVLDFIYASQPKEWDKMRKQHGADAKNLLLHRLASEIKKRGTLEVLRKGIKANGCKFRLAYFRPASGLNESLQKLYRANVFSIVRQLKYSQQNSNSLDLVLFLNGLPIFTAELKNPLNGQNVETPSGNTGETVIPRAAPRPSPLPGSLRRRSESRVRHDSRGTKTRFLPFNHGNGRRRGIPQPGAVSPRPTSGSRSGLGTACSTSSNTSFTRPRTKTSRAGGGAKTFDLSALSPARCGAATGRGCPRDGTRALVPHRAQRREWQEQLHRLARPSAVEPSQRTISASSIRSSW